MTKSIAIAGLNLMLGSATASYADNKGGQQRFEVMKSLTQISAGFKTTNNMNINTRSDGGSQTFIVRKAVTQVSAGFKTKNNMNINANHL